MEQAQLVEMTRWLATAVMGGAAVTFELRTRHIPNWLTLGGLIPALVVAASFGRIGDALLGWLVASVVGVLAFQRGALAGGGVKTAALLGACAGIGGGLALAAGGAIFLMAFDVLERRAVREGRGLEGWRSTPAMLALALAGLGARLALTGASTP